MQAHELHLLSSPLGMLASTDASITHLNCCNSLSRFSPSPFPALPAAHWTPTPEGPAPQHVANTLPPRLCTTATHHPYSDVRVLGDLRCQ